MPCKQRAPVEAGEDLAQHLGGVVHLGQPEGARAQCTERLPQLCRAERPATLQEGTTRSGSASICLGFQCV